MNKSAIQKFAIWARTTLMEQVAQRSLFKLSVDGKSPSVSLNSSP